ncbi:hypothetical protein ABT095_01505 [Kitasatospora sp. NPDC002227]|uniref:hypothetical protein n=1 Tax=Kitasatospora sp. NPDC002227 TaxID=3154773 RepID=UPI00331FB210
MPQQKPYWQPYWWRLLHQDDRTPDWVPLGPPSAVPNAALSTTSLDAWAEALLAEAVEELEDLRGRLLLECYDRPDGTDPVLARGAALTGPAAARPSRGSAAPR